MPNPDQQQQQQQVQQKQVEQTTIADQHRRDVLLNKNKRKHTEDNRQRQTKNDAWGKPNSLYPGFGEQQLKNTETMVGQAQYDLDNYLAFLLVKYAFVAMDAVVFPLDVLGYRIKFAGEDDATSRAFAQAWTEFKAANRTIFPPTQDDYVPEYNDEENKENDIPKEKPVTRHFDNVRDGQAADQQPANPAPAPLVENQNQNGGVGGPQPPRPQGF